MATNLMFLTFYIIVTFVESSRDFIVYSAAESRRGSPGLYGGFYEFGKKFDMELIHINVANYRQTDFTNNRHYDRKVSHGFTVYSLSYDPVSKDLLLYLIHEERMEPYLARINPCKDESVEEGNLYMAQGQYYRRSAFPFALYDSIVYYVAREKQDGTTSFTIRRLTKCENDEERFMHRKPCNAMDCSTEVARIIDYEESLTNYFDLVVASTLVVIKKDEKLHFLVQIGQKKHVTGRVYKYSMTMYEVEQGGQGKVLNTRMTSNSDLVGVSITGAISYKDGLLCWSTYEDIFCESWPRTRKVPSVTHVLKKGDARSVCNVTDTVNDELFQDAITGIQIIKTNPLQIAFGCWFVWRNNGGAGYLYSDPEGTIRNVTAMEDTKGKIFAGPMVAIDSCSNP